MEKVWKMRGMKKRERGTKKGMIMKQMAIAVIILVAFVAPASAGAATLTVTPSSCTSGTFVEIKGEGFQPGETVTLESTCTCRKPVVEGEVECCLQEFNISNENTGFSLSVSPVKENVALYIKRSWYSIYWTIDHNMMGFVFDYDPATHTSTVTRGKPTPMGVYKVIDVIGKAVDGVCDVEMKTTISTEVTADGAGKFTDFVDTLGIPAGAYKIKAKGQTSGEYAETTLNLLLKGDVGGDGYVGAYDCVCIARYVVGIPGYTADTLNLDLYSADVNGDGKVDIRDARYLARYLVGLESVLH